jgi:hypothetical protein
MIASDGKKHPLAIHSVIGATAVNCSDLRHELALITDIEFDRDTNMASCVPIEKYVVEFFYKCAV